MKEFFINNSENIIFLIYGIVYLVVPLLVIFLLLLLISRKSDKSRKEKIHAVSVCLGDILTTSFLCGCMFFFGFAMRDQILLENPDWNNNIWNPSYAIWGTGYVVFCYMLLAIFCIPLMILKKHIKRS